ncbi:helix-turn-helix domain-containing protein [Brevibacillus sp. B_LB10_24]|uniref:helix-turn-helix domain-containing protein n=1 Tax=Brevibacillus sp. B_LB10_24 TaxID=3380645 RepID=UPI0038BA9A1E
MQNKLGEYLRELRGNRSLREIAELTGLSHTYIADVENGYRRGTNKPIKPSPETLRKLARALKVNYGEFLDKAGYLEGFTDEEKRQIIDNSQLMFNLDSAIEFFIDIFKKDYPFADNLDRDLFVAIENVSKKSGAKVKIKISVTDSRENNYKKIYDTVCSVEKVQIKVALLEALKEIAKKYHLWSDPKQSLFIKENPDPFTNEKEFLSEIDLSDEELMQRYKVMVDGRELTEKEWKKLLAFLRMERDLD